MNMRARGARAVWLKIGIKFKECGPPMGIMAATLKERISEDLGMSPRQLPKNTACGGGGL